MYQLTAADFADTGQWRLLLKIGMTGLESFLENTLHPEIEPQPLCKVEWDFNRDMLRKNIEDAVYNNPRLLDDFSTRIILYDPRTLFIPTIIAEEKAGEEEIQYTRVYSAEESDIMSDSDGDITAVWSLAPGVKSFLQRTFAGARITCNLMEEVRNLRKNNEGISVYAITRTGETDIILLKNKDLLSASTHEWNHHDDIAYLVLNLLDVYNINISDVTVLIEGFIADSDAWRYIFRHSGNAKTNEENNNI